CLRAESKTCLRSKHPGVFVMGEVVVSSREGVKKVSSEDNVIDGHIGNGKTRRSSHHDTFSSRVTVCIERESDNTGTAPVAGDRNHVDVRAGQQCGGRE